MPTCLSSHVESKKMQHTKCTIMSFLALLRNEKIVYKFEFPRTIQHTCYRLEYVFSQSLCHI